MDKTDEIKSRIQFLEKENAELREKLSKCCPGEEDLPPDRGEEPGITFYDLFDVDEIQAVQDAFSSAVGIASLVTAPDGSPITKPSNFCRLCRDIIRNSDKGRENCINSDRVLGSCNTGGPVVRPCLSSGLYDAGASILAGDRHIASWLMGQVRTEFQGEEELVAYADEIGVDREEYKQALSEIPVIPLEKFRKTANALYLFANLLSRIALQNLERRRDVYQLRGLLPICASCKKIRDDKGYWNRIETYIENHSTAVFSHGLCPECAEKLYGKEKWFKKENIYKDRGD